MPLPARRSRWGARGAYQRPRGRRPRHILLGVSHASNDPARHRDFAIRATYDQAANGWVAQVAEQNRNEQPGAWAAEVLMDGIRSHVFPTAAACRGCRDERRHPGRPGGLGPRSRQRSWPRRYVHQPAPSRPGSVRRSRGLPHPLADEGKVQLRLQMEVEVMPRDEGCERQRDGLIEATGLGGTEHGALQGTRSHW